jgi:hypothetical protein
VGGDAATAVRDDEPRGRDPEAAASDETVESHPDGDWRRTQVARLQQHEGLPLSWVRSGNTSGHSGTLWHGLMATLMHRHRRHWHSACWSKRHQRKPKFRT